MTTSFVSDLITAPSGAAARLRRVVNGPAVVFGAAILLIWMATTETGLVGAAVLPSPAALGTAFVDLVGSAVLWSAVWATLSTWIVSLIIAVLLAAVLGVLLGSSAGLYRAVSGLIEFFRPIPSVAILPLFLLLYGATDSTKILLTAYTAFWPMIVQTIYGVLGTDPVLKDVAATLNLGPVATRWRIALPSALPSMAVGFRIGASVSLILCVTLEIIVGMEGLGREIFVAQSSGATDRMHTLIAVTGLLGWGVNALFQRVERATLHWHSAHRNGPR
ncbi:ABC transporter permease [Nocardioides sp. L-11A]|uniref:ABC transporter permease n=1 Tax=Nocardioides sp. L-11A TaxID=3043848 RepID=UPI00249BCB55|nr:ABC transporter permease subunit [Nocardioides sp. L-11A]